MLVEPPGTSPTRVAPSFTSNQSPRATITPSTHTYRLFTLLKSVRASGFCQTDAKRRDYTILTSWVKGKPSLPRDCGSQPRVVGRARGGRLVVGGHLFQ